MQRYPYIMKKYPYGAIETEEALQMHIGKPIWVVHGKTDLFEFEKIEVLTSKKSGKKYVKGYWSFLANLYEEVTLESVNIGSFAGKAFMFFDFEDADSYLKICEKIKSGAMK